MATSDATFATDAELDEQVRSRSSAASSRPRNGKPGRLGQSTPVIDVDGERAPLLGAAGGLGGSAGSEAEGDSSEWFGTADFRGLPWWKRPSVRVSRSIDMAL